MLTFEERFESDPLSHSESASEQSSVIGVVRLSFMMVADDVGGQFELGTVAHV